MDESPKLLLTVAIPTVTVLVGILVNNRQLDALDRRFTSEIAALRAEMNAKFEAMHQALLRFESVLDTRLRHLEERQM